MYKSSYPWVDIPDLSLYTFLLGEEYTSSRGFDPDSVAFFDALVPQRRITRQELRERSLSLGWSIRNTLGAKLGDVAMIFR